MGAKPDPGPLVLGWRLGGLSIRRQARVEVSAIAPKLEPSSCATRPETPYESVPPLRRPGFKRPITETNSPPGPATPSGLDRPVRLPQCLTTFAIPRRCWPARAVARRLGPANPAGRRPCRARSAAACTEGRRAQARHVAIKMRSRPVASPDRSARRENSRACGDSFPNSIGWCRISLTLPPNLAAQRVP